VRRNDLAFVRETVSRLDEAGIATWLFGGWGEELLGLVASRRHHDLDLLYPAEDFRRVDNLMAADHALTEIAAKRLPHKRAFLRCGVMTELFLVRSSSASSGPAYFTKFWDESSYAWPADVLGTEVDGLRVASAAALQRYRADHHYIRAISKR
jgi:aminoglycoside-2''-adenylyltransferase